MEVCMVTIIDESHRLSVPSWVTDLEAFRRWTDADDFPEEYRIWWLRGEVCIDMSKEQIFTHVRVKTRFTRVLDQIADEDQLGMYLTDGVLLSSFTADVSGKPDGLFVSSATLNSDRVRLIEGKEEGFVELQGSPDMVLEIVSTASEHKDYVVLKQAYHEAGIREYWLVDVRQEAIVFDIFRHTERGYVRSSKQQGWVKSGVFGKGFRLTRRPGPPEQPDFSLEVR
jgi:Uma2 family endonuclease